MTGFRLSVDDGAFCQQLDGVHLSEMLTFMAEGEVGKFAECLETVERLFKGLCEMLVG